MEGVRFLVVPYSLSFGKPFCSDVLWRPVLGLSIMFAQAGNSVLNLINRSWAKIEISVKYLIKIFRDFNQPVQHSTVMPWSGLGNSAELQHVLEVTSEEGDTWFPSWPGYDTIGLLGKGKGNSSTVSNHAFFFFSELLEEYHPVILRNNWVRGASEGAMWGKAGGLSRETWGSVEWAAFVGIWWACWQHGEVTREWKEARGKGGLAVGNGHRQRLVVGCCLFACSLMLFKAWFFLAESWAVSLGTWG